MGGLRHVPLGPRPATCLPTRSNLLPLLGTDGSDGWVAQGYAAGRIEADGLDWLPRQLQRWPDAESVPQQVGLLLAVMRPNEALVAIVNGLDPAFWQRVNTMSVDPGARPVVARTLIGQRRPWGAIDLIVTMLHAVGGAVEPDMDLVESALMNAATGPSSDYYAEREAHHEQVPPERNAIAMVGYTVIREWRTPPGVRPDGTVDADALGDWVTEARRLLAESGRSTIGDLVIGEVLAYVPPDADGLWPAEPVRDLIEDLGSPKLEEGLHTGRFNSRGMTFRNPADGGAQERQLAAQHREWAEYVSDRWPGTGALLRQIADHYDEWARLRTISPSASATTTPEPSPRGRAAWRRGRALHPSQQSTHGDGVQATRAACS